MFRTTQETKYADSNTNARTVGDIFKLLFLNLLGRETVNAN
jgi:hypothetical protein